MSSVCMFVLLSVVLFTHTYIYESSWSTVCNFALLMNLLDTHLSFNCIQMFIGKVGKHKYTQTVCCCCNPHPDLQFNSFLSLLLLFESLCPCCWVQVIRGIDDGFSCPPPVLLDSLIMEMAQS